MYNYVSDRDVKRLRRTARESDARLPAAKAPRFNGRDLVWIASPVADIDHNDSGEVYVAEGVPPDFTFESGTVSAPIGIEDTNDNAWGWSTGEEAVWTTSTPGTPFTTTIEAWNFTGATIPAQRSDGTETPVLIHRTMAKQSSGGFWTMIPLALTEERWINGTADQDIDPGDELNDGKTITVVRGDEATDSQHVVEHILHQAGGTISLGKVVTARWWPARAAYVIHLADCED